MLPRDNWIDERDRLASELRKSMGDQEIRDELRDRWDAELDDAEADPALMLANIRLTEETDATAGETV
jgi:hypothetical protein